uniref:DUF2306 domain-containing protein n=1 Tax=Microbispora cellulosiformans TaxID=2614688 RepID=UPI001CD9AB63|nr:DUF2306 domain-containing protein [Microbispora cellulosiformans]
MIPDTERTAPRATPVRRPEGRPGGRPPAPAARRPRAWWRRPWIIPLGIVVAAFLAYELPPYLTLDPARARVVLPAAFPPKYAVLIGHIVFGTVAQVTIFLQMWPWLRRRHPAVHRWSGRVYVFAGAIPSAVAAVVMLPFTPVPGRVGVSTAAVLWLVTTVMGYRMARRRRFAEHRRWMLYNFAIVAGINYTGLAIVVVGTHLPVAVDPVYLIEAARWLGWVVNLVVVQWWIDRRRTRPAAGFAGLAG